jgi:hypothetical protein
MNARTVMLVPQGSIAEHPDMYQSVQWHRQVTTGDKNRDCPAQFCDNDARRSGCVTFQRPTLAIGR